MTRPVLRLSALALAATLAPAASALSFYPPAQVNPTMYDEYNYRRFVTAEVADLDGDGRVDVLLAEQEPGVLLRQFRIGDDGKLVFDRDDTIPGFGSTYSAHVIRSGDVDGDGMLELFTVDSFRKWVAILGRDADGRYSERTRLPHPFAEGVFDQPGVQVADVTRDGIPDVLVHAHRELLMYRGLGGMAFAEPTHMLSYGSGGIALADIDGDGRQDLFAASNQGGMGMAFGGTGPHRFRQLGFEPTETTHHDNAVATGDLDNDGMPEGVLAYVTYEYVGSNEVRQEWKLGMFSASGPQQLAAPVFYTIRASINPINLDMVVADIDRDGDDEAIIRYNGRIDILEFDDGAMTVWQLPYTAWASQVPQQNVFVADLTGDGCPDAAELGAFAFVVHAQRGGCGTAPATTPASKEVPPKLGVEPDLSRSPTTARSRRSSS